MTTRLPPRGDRANTPDPVRVYLREVGRVALLDASQEVALAKRIEVGVFAAERLRHLADTGQVLDLQLCRDLRSIVVDGRRARDHLLEAAAGLEHVADHVDHVNRHADRPRLIGDRPADGLADPPRRVRAEPVPHVIVVLLDGA